MEPADRPAFADALRWTAIDGLRIRFIEEAKLEGPDILILSPWPEGLAAYQDCWPALTAAGRVVALDLPGFGGSEGRRDLASPGAMAEFLMKVIERFRLSHPHLMALGIWWTVAADVSVAEPGALESLIVSPDMMAGDRNAAPSARRPTRHALEREVRAALAGSRVPEARRCQILREFAGSRFRLVAAYLRAHRAAGRAAAAALSALSTPVLTIEGRGDAEGGGPFAWIEAPEAFGRIVADWVAAGYRRVGGLTIARVGTYGAGARLGGLERSKMSLNAYEITLPVMDRGLDILDDYVDEAARLAEAQGRPVEEILNARLAPDMLSFAEQVAVLCRKAERHAAALGKQDRPGTQQGDPTIAGLKARIRAARAFLQAVPEAEVLGAEARPYELSEPLIRGWLGGKDYILSLVLPDFFFHQSMAHALLRHLGSPIGKRFYLGRLELDSGGYD